MKRGLRLSVWVILHLSSFIFLTGCASPTAVQTAAQLPESKPAPTLTPIGVQKLTPAVVASYPHDPTAFTQGLLVHPSGDLIETTGLYGQSRLRRVVLEDGTATQEVMLGPSFFGEGVAWTGTEFVWLTWQAGIAHRFDEQFNLLGTWNYEGEGWGLCFDGQDLYMSDGTAVVTRRSPADFRILDSRTVTNEGQPVVRLNELACVGESIYANIWQSDEIVLFEKESGVVTAVVEASNLLTPDQRQQLSDQSNDVLNGIAYDPVQDLFYLTGKRWPLLFAVRFEPEP